jgi:hypothetical protein
MLQQAQRRANSLLANTSMGQGAHIFFHQLNRRPQTGMISFFNSR